MKKYEREKYTLVAYHNEKYSLEIEDDELHTVNTEYSNNWETLYAKAKKEAEKGKKCLLMEIKYEFFG